MPARPLQLPADLDRLAAHPGWRAGNVLDVREADRFLAGHLPGAVNIPVTAALARARGTGHAELAAGLPSIFLPPRDEALVVVAGSRELAGRVADHLRGRGRDATLAVVWPTAGAGLGPRWLERGPGGRHLWQPPPFLVRWSRLLPPPAAGAVLDLACGSGRAAVWLARRGHRVTGIDWQAEALALAHRLALHERVTVDLQRGDLREPGNLPAGPWSAVLNFRFLHRPLLADLPRILRPGAVVVVRTFRDAPGYLGNPRPRHRLARGELAQLLPAPDFRLLVHEEDFDPDGRPAAGAVARWRG